ncbi:MAG TPA: response regulator [Gammaproteobacteria bacterium]|nr:response regulator [Gammaproteobacteria bacterium]
MSLLPEDNDNRKLALVISRVPQSLEEILSHFQERGFKVLHARNGGEGLRFARKTDPSIIVLDISETMTFDESLLEQTLTLLELKSDDQLSKIPLVVTTQKSSQENLGLMLSEVHFLSKPIDINIMIRKIKELLPEGVSTLLVVDDDESARDIMTAAAKKAGWNSIEAINGRDALNKMADVLPSIILLDLMMPEMDGFSLIEELQKKEQWRDIPIIIVSAKELTPDENTMLKKYSKSILQKGAHTRQELVDAICEVETR